ncbi:MAG: ribonuclease J, partial [Clostridia bacterium]|nr:ribonuclease J [Clostridia bacterium]
MEEVRTLATQTINDCLDSQKNVDRMELKTCIKDNLSKYLYAKTKRKPMVLPVIMNL